MNKVKQNNDWIERFDKKFPRCECGDCYLDGIERFKEIVRIVTE